MYKILKRKVIAFKTVMLHVEAPAVAKTIQQGQFIMLKLNEYGERIPISISGWNREEGWLRIVIMGAGRTSNEILLMQEGDEFESLVGPLGVPSHVGKYGTCVLLGGGYGAGAIIPVAEKLKELGNKVIGVVGARNKELLVMHNELKEVVDDLYITTNDGSEGIKGFVTNALSAIMEKENVAWVMAVGPVPMMKAVAELTREDKIPTYASLNAIMVDGTGMCGACRVTVGDKTKFACIHGPDFDAHQTNFEELMLRQGAYKEPEAMANDKFKDFDFSKI
jgi:ferredoxin--NADP+ reductase